MIRPASPICMNSTSASRLFYGVYDSGVNGRVATGDIRRILASSSWLHGEKIGVESVRLVGDSNSRLTCLLSASTVCNFSFFASS